MSNTARHDHARATESDPTDWSAFPQRQTSSLEWTAILGVVIVGAALRIWAFAGQSLTSDEITELNIARLPADIGQIIDGSNRFPFLYHSVLRMWLVVSPNPESARLLSALFGLATILAIWRLARHIAGKEAGLMAAGFAATSPFLVWYSIETRAYGLVILFAALTLLVLARLMENPSGRNWALFVAASAGGLFTHYYFVLLLIVLLPFLLGYRIIQDSGRRAVTAFIAFAVLAVPWMMSLNQDLRGEWGASRFSNFGVGGAGYTYFSFLSGYTLGPSQRELHTLSLSEALPALAPWLIVITTAALIIGLAGYVALRGSRWRSILIALVIAPVVVVGLASELGPFGFNVRHVSWVFVPISCWMGAGIAQWRSRRLVRLATIALVLISGAALINRTSLDRYRNEDSRSVAQQLATTAERGNVFVTVNYMALAIDEYLPETWSALPLEDVTMSGNGLEAALTGVESGASEGPVWIAYTREFHGDPGGVLLDALLEGGAILEGSHAGIDLYRLAAQRRDIAPNLAGRGG